MADFSKQQKPPWRDKLVDLADRRSRSILLRMAGNNAWDVCPGAPQWTPRTPLYLYLLDGSGQRTVMGVVNWEDLDRVADWARALSAEEVCSAVFELLNNSDRAGSTVESDAAENELLLALIINYLAKTKTFRRVPHGTHNVHAVVLVYRPHGLPSAEGILRPFALVGKDRDGVLAPEELTVACERVVQQDKTAHPDWFSSASLLKFPRS